MTKCPHCLQEMPVGVEDEALEEPQGDQNPPSYVMTLESLFEG